MSVQTDRVFFLESIYNEISGLVCKTSPETVKMYKLANPVYPNTQKELAIMKFQMEKLGCLHKAEIELGDLTIICGYNNTGKTYVNYAIYGFLKFWINKTIFKIPKENMEKLIQYGIVTFDLKIFEKEIPNILNNLSREYTKFIPSVFSADESHFSDTSFLFSIQNVKPIYDVEFNSQFFFGTKENLVLKAVKSKNSHLLEISIVTQDKNFLISHADKIKEFINYSTGMILVSNYFPRPFIITSERNGISLFHKELDITKNVLVETLQEQGKRKNKTEIGDIFGMINTVVSRYARPIKDNIDFVRDIAEHSKKKSMLIQKHPELKKELNRMSGGDYKAEGSQILFSFKNKRITKKIPVHLASSGIKSQLDLNFYIRHIAREGDLLMIDEPELNLHPANQRRMARFFARLIKAGIRVFITTHSDYIIKELNNLVILGNEFEDKEKIMKQYGYTEEDIIDKNMLKVYIAEDNTLKKAHVDDFGIEIGSFDHEINEMNQMFDKMTVNMESAYGSN